MTLIRRASNQARLATPFRAVRAKGQEADCPPMPPPEDAPEQQLARVRDECEALIRQVESLKTEAENARRQGFEEGRAAGRDEAECREAERLAQLTANLRDARNDLVNRLGGERDLAAEIALAALRRAIGDPAHYRDLVTATARHHAASLERGTILGLSVSPADFGDAQKLAQLQATLDQVRIELDPELPAGGCRFDLTLGQLEADIPAQAQALEALLLQPTVGIAERV